MSEIDFNKANREWAELQVQTGIPETPPSSPECDHCERRDGSHEPGCEHEASPERVCDHCGKPMPEGYEVVNYNGKVGRLHSECVDAAPPSRSERGWLKPIVEAAQRDVETWPEWQRKGIQEAANASPEQEARAWRLAHINEFRTMHHNTFGGGGMITDYDGMLAAYAAHIRQQEREQDARIAKTYADGGCSGDAIAAAIRSQEGI